MRQKLREEGEPPEAPEAELREGEEPREAHKADHESRNESFHRNSLPKIVGPRAPALIQ